MKAIVYRKYGKPNVVSFEDVPKPNVDENHVLVKIHAASINQADLYILQGKPFPLRFTTGLFKPKNQILGSDFSGVIEELGDNVTEYKVGDEVFGQLVFEQDGAYAEYAVMKPSQLTLKPSNVTHSEAASTPMAVLTAIQGLRLAEAKKGTNLLLYGASGGVGTFMIQVAKHLGAKVTAVCSTRNIDSAKHSGADVIIDYKKEHWDKDNIKYDAIVGVNGYNKLSRYRDAMTKDGIYVVAGGSMKQIFATSFQAFLRNKENRQFKGYVAKVVKEDFNLMSEMLEKGALKPYIDKEFPLEKTNEALEHFLSNKNIGKTIIKVV